MTTLRLRRELLINNGPGRLVVAWNHTKHYIEVFYIERDGWYKKEPWESPDVDVEWIKQAIAEVRAELAETGTS